jgi:hypothetical protein
MKGFILSLQSEFYKSRKTLGFWAAIILPSIICALVFMGFYNKSSGLTNAPGLLVWMIFSSVILGVMGFVLPFFVVIVGYSVNSIEHKADTWKTLFSLPISKISVYAAKYVYALLLVFICLLLFLTFTIGLGNLLGMLKPELKFADYHMESTLTQVYFKLFLSALGILSIQFLMSLVWADFLKPMGIGFVCIIAGFIMAQAKWDFAYLFPYAHPSLAFRDIVPHMVRNNKSNTVTPQFTIDIFTKDVYVGLAVAVVVFVAGFYIVQRKSVK